IALIGITEMYQESGDEEQIEHYITQTEKVLRDSIAITPDPFSSVLLAQTLLSQNKKLDEAETLLLQARDAELEQRTETLLEANLGKIAIEHDDMQKALKHYQRAAEISPDFPGIWLEIGSIQHMLGQPEVAEQSLLRSIEQEPHLVYAYNELATI